MATALDYEALKERQRAQRGGWPQPLALRTHRALSWLHRAERERDDHDARYIFLWIAFNAAYANEIPDRWDLSERKLQMLFLKKLIESDRDKLLYRMVWQRYSGPLRLFVETLDRLYVLRNQLLHGGATWNSSVNRSQVTDGARILGDVVPIVIHLMMENPQQLWGEACYPVVDDDSRPAP